MPNSSITIIGNLVDDPELRFTPNGQAVARVRVAVGDRYFDKNKDEWVDSDPSFFTVNIWRQMGENVAETFRRGDRVIVTGRMRQRSYEKEDEVRYVYEIEATDIGASMMFASAKLTKAIRTDKSEAEDEPADEVASKRTAKSTSARPRSTTTRSRR